MACDRGGLNIFCCQRLVEVKKNVGKKKFVTYLSTPISIQLRVVVCRGRCPLVLAYMNATNATIRDTDLLPSPPRRLLVTPTYSKNI